MAKKSATKKASAKKPAKKTAAKSSNRTTSAPKRAGIKKKVSKSTEKTQIKAKKPPKTTNVAGTPPPTTTHRSRLQPWRVTTRASSLQPPASSLQPPGFGLFLLPRIPRTVSQDGRCTCNASVSVLAYSYELSDTESTHAHLQMAADRRFPVRTAHDPRSGAGNRRPGDGNRGPYQPSGPLLNPVGSPRPGGRHLRQLAARKRQTPRGVPALSRRRSPLRRREDRIRGRAGEV